MAFSCGHSVKESALFERWLKWLFKEEKKSELRAELRKTKKKTSVETICSRSRKLSHSDVRASQRLESGGCVAKDGNCVSTIDRNFSLQVNS